MGQQGRYLFEPYPRLRTNGAGLAVRSQYSRVTWTFTALTLAQYEWWTVTLLNYDLARFFGSTTGILGNGTALENNRGVFVPVRAMIVNAPEYESAGGGYYRNVKVTFDRIFL